MPNEVTVNLVKIVLPFQQNGVTIRMVSSTMLRLTTEFGVDLLWDRALSLEIQLSSDYKNKVRSHLHLNKWCFYERMMCQIMPLWQNID